MSGLLCLHILCEERLRMVSSWLVHLNSRRLLIPNKNAENLQYNEQA